MKSVMSGLLLGCGAALLGAQLLSAQVGQDLKQAGADTKNAATTAGHKTKKGVQKGYSSSTHGVKKGVHKTATATEKGAGKLGDKTSTQ